MRKIIFFFVFLLATGSLCADVVHLKNGGKVEGEITETEGGVQVKSGNGATMDIAREEIERIEKKESVFSEYSKRSAQIPADNVAKRLELLRWCQNKQFKKESADEAKKIIALQPDNAEAHYALGEIKIGPDWISLDLFLQKYSEDCNTPSSGYLYGLLRRCEIDLDDAKATIFSPAEKRGRFVQVPLPDVCAAEKDDLEQSWAKSKTAERFVILKDYVTAYASTPLAKRTKAREEIVKASAADQSDVVSCGKCHGAGEINEKIVCKKCNGQKKLTEKCQICSGKKDLPCPKCEGSGSMKDPVCKGAGRVTCVMGLGIQNGGCSGTGNCPFCGGTKWRTIPDGEYTRRVPCQICNQTGICQKCNGNKTLGCLNCEGSGKVNCTKCNRKGTLRCVKCNSRGEIVAVCPECKGIGEKLRHEQCAECTGKGRWHKTPDFHKAQVK